MPTTLSPDIKAVAEKLIQQAFFPDDDGIANDDITVAFLFPSETEIRLIYLDRTAFPSDGQDRVMPFYFGTDPASGLPFRSAVALIRPEELDALQPPDGWGTWHEATAYDVTDAAGL